MNILALLFVRNEAPYIATCLENLIRQELQIHVLDNDSSDGTTEIARSFLGQGVVAVEHVPFPGYYDLRALLTRLQEVANHSTADWFIRSDADEILKPCPGFQTLRQGIQAADRQGYNIVNFDEFVFLPTAEDTEGFEGTDFVKSMRYYYFFEPKPHRLQRAWKRQDSGVDLTHSGGHVPSILDRRILPHSFALRHYVVLSRSHALSKYLGRIYNVSAHVERGWHTRRIHFTPDDLRLPPRHKLKKLGPDERWDRSDPKVHHEFLGPIKDTKAARNRWRPPSGPTPTATPVPFIVGVGRSGTTLLRMMLDAHPELAIPPETHVLPRLAALGETRGDPVQSFLNILTASPTWGDFTLDEFEIEAALRRVQPFDLSHAVRALYRLYARRLNKRRWGDKTPRYIQYMFSVARLRVLAVQPSKCANG